VNVTVDRLGQREIEGDGGERPIHAAGVQLVSVSKPDSLQGLSASDRKSVSFFSVKSRLVAFVGPFKE
jgi:hypothetical protein